MDISTLENDIASLRKDISSLEQEMDPLTEEYFAIKSQLDSLKSRPRKDTTPFEKNDDDDMIPELVQHSHFDDSIARFFSDVPPEKVSADNELSYDLLAKAEASVELKENITYENIFRFGGISAFPINKTLFSDDDEVLGLRFDVFSHFSKKYTTPHYVILKKTETVTKQTETKWSWSVFRHTIPPYVPLPEYEAILNEDIDTDTALTRFVQSIRNYLVNTQYKHDKFDTVSLLNYSAVGLDGSDRIVKSIEKDLECHRVIIHLNTSQLNLTCSDSAVESASTNVKLDLANTEEIDLTVSALLHGVTFNDLTKTFRSVFKYLHQQGVISP